MEAECEEALLKQIVAILSGGEAYTYASALRANAGILLSCAA